MKGLEEAIIYTLRKTTLTRDDIGKLTLRQFVDTHQLVVAQEGKDDYLQTYHVATLVAAIANTVPRRSGRTYKAEDFLAAQGDTAPSGYEFIGKDELDKYDIKLPSG